MDFTPKQQQLIEEYCANDMRKLKRICYPKIRKACGDSNMDEDDIYSISMDVLMKGVKMYNESLGGFDNLLSSCIQRKINTYIRDTKYRLKRSNVQTDDKGNSVYIPNISLDIPAEDGIDLCERVASNFNIEDNLSEEFELSSDERVEEYLDSLPRKASEIIRMKMNDIPVAEIKAKLKLSDGEYNNYMKVARTNENLALFAKSTNYKEDYKMCEIMPIDITDSYRMDKNPLGTLLDEKRDKKINCKHLFQRVAYQWTKKEKNKFLTRILNNQPIPEIIICEQTVNDKKKRHLIDGLQRLSYAELYRSKGTVIEEEGAEFPEIYYRERMLVNGEEQLDEDGDPKEETKVFNVIGKKFDELPSFLQERFNKFNINVTTFFNCTDEQIAYHIRNYNNHEGMNKNQYEMTNISVETAKQIKEISQKHPFFKDEYGKYTSKNKVKADTDRVVAESLVAINCLSEWKKEIGDLYKVVDEKVTNNMFENFKEELGRLCKIVNKENRVLFNTTNSLIWFAVFDKFKSLQLNDQRFVDFTRYFLESLSSLNIEIKGENFVDIYKSRDTKNKNVIAAKINGILILMNEFLHIDTKESQPEKEDIVSNNNELNLNISISTYDFVRENVRNDIEPEDIETYEESLYDYTIEIDENGKRIVDNNIQAFVALVAHAFSKEEDDNIPKWLIEYINKDIVYTQNQKENYLHMKQDFNKYIKQKEMEETVLCYS